MSTNQQNLLLPNSPLLLVHRGWRRSRKKAAVAITVNGAQIEKSDILGDVTVPSSKYPFIHSIVVPRLPDGDKAVFDSPTDSGLSPNFMFVNTTGPSKTPTRDVRKLMRRHVRRRVGHTQTKVRGECGSGSVGSWSAAKPEVPFVPQSASELEVEVSLASPVLSPVCPGAGTAMYGAALPFTLNLPLWNLMNYCKSGGCMYSFGHVFPPLSSLHIDHCLTKQTSAL